MNITVYSGTEYLAVSLEGDLQRAHLSQGAVKSIIIDRPTGWAFLDYPLSKMPESLVLSDNPCPEYRLELWEYQPLGLVEEISLNAVLNTVKALEEGAFTRSLASTHLTPSERVCLRLVAGGKTNKEIAVARKVTEGTVKNSLSSISDKLGLKTRIQLAHYYYGNWHLLKGWRSATLAFETYASNFR